MSEGPVCAWCDVNVRDVRCMYDDEGRVVQRFTVCAYCGRTELRPRKLGHQTPIPPVEKPPRASRSEAMAMNDNVLDLPPRGPARHRAILAAREQYLDDSLRRPGDGVLIDADEMRAGVAKIIGDEVSADDLKAAVQWWNVELQKQFQERYDMPSVELAQQIEKYKAALEAFAESFTQLLVIHHAAMPVITKDRDEDLFFMRWLGELQAQAELMHEFCRRAPSTLQVMRDDLENSFRYWQPRMDETMQVAWRTMIEKHNHVLAMLGRTPDTIQWGRRPTVDPPSLKAQPRQL